MNLFPYPTKTKKKFKEQKSFIRQRTQSRGDGNDDDNNGNIDIILGNDNHLRKRAEPQFRKTGTPAKETSEEFRIEGICYL